MHHHQEEEDELVVSLDPAGSSSDNPDHSTRTATKKRKTSKGETPIGNSSTGSSSTTALLVKGTERSTGNPSTANKGVKVLFPLAPCVLGTRPPDDLLYHIVRFLKQNLPKYPSSFDDGGSIIEVEGKLGLLLDRGNECRIELPVVSECVMDPGSRGWYNFAADVGVASFERCTSRLAHVHGASASGSSSSSPYPKMRREEQLTVDRMYEYEGSLIRVTTAQASASSGSSNTSPILECITKTKVAHLDIFNPAAPLDYRISINVEKYLDPAVIQPLLPSLKPVLTRYKTRTSYLHELCRLDATFVLTHQASSTTPVSPEKGWEFEVELVDAKTLMTSPSMTAVVEPLVNNLRAFSRLCAS